jgi:hypothetical protein
LKTEVDKSEAKKIIFSYPYSIFIFLPLVR